MHFIFNYQSHTSRLHIHKPISQTTIPLFNLKFLIHHIKPNNLPFERLLVNRLCLSLSIPVVGKKILLPRVVRSCTGRGPRNEDVRARSSFYDVHTSGVTVSARARARGICILFFPLGPPSSSLPPPVALLT